MFVIKFKNTDCWIADWEGDPGRTLKKKSAKRFDNHTSALYKVKELVNHFPNRFDSEEDLEIEELKYDNHLPCVSAEMTIEVSVNCPYCNCLQDITSKMSDHFDEISRREMNVSHICEFSKCGKEFIIEKINF